MENKSNKKTYKDHTVSLQDTMGVDGDMRHWAIYGGQYDVLSEKEHLAKIMGLADDLYFGGHYNLKQHCNSEELIESLYSYAKSKGIKLEAKSYDSMNNE